MKDKAYLVLTTNLILSMFYFGYLIRIFDQVLSDASGKNFNTIANPVWQTIITMTTVGYGDFFSLSTESRIIWVFCAFYGVYLVSLFVIALDSVLHFDQAEERSYDLLCRLEDKEELKLEAVNVLTSAFRHRKAKNETPDNKSLVLDKLKTFRKYLMNFQKIAKAIRGNYGTENPNDSVRDEIDELRENIKTLRGSLEALSEHFGVELIDTRGSSNNKSSTDDSKR